MRLFNRLLAVIVALVLLGVGVVTIIEVVRGALHQPHLIVPWETMTQWLRAHSWNASLSRLILILVAVAGLLILLAQLTPRRRRLIALAPLTPAVETSTTRRSLQRSLSQAATEVEGVADAGARVRRRRAVLDVTSRLRAAPNLEEQVTERVSRRLQDLSVDAAPRLVVRMHQRKGR